MNWKEFISIPNGTRIFNHGYDQCVAVANLYNEEVVPGGSFVPVASAYQWWTDFERYPQLTSRYVKSNTPVAGCIFVSRGGIYDTANGHIGVVTSLNKSGYVDTIEQNATHRYLWRYTRGMQNMLGFLIPINNPANIVPEPIKPEPVFEKDEEMRTFYVRPTNNSSPVKPGDATSSRIWAGDNRIYKGIAYSGTWAFDSVTGEGRRMTMAEWQTVQEAFKASEQKMPLSQPTGNILEIMMFAKKIPGL